MAPLRPGLQAEKKGRKVRTVVYLIAFIVVLGPVAALEMPSEIARWLVAAATDRRLDGNTKSAVELLSRAIAWDRDNAELLLQRAQWKLEAGDAAGAIADSGRVIRLAADAPAGYMIRAQAYQRAGRHQEAIRDFDRIVKISPEATMFRCRALNARAYARALANRDIDAGLKDVGDALCRLDDQVARADAYTWRIMEGFLGADRDRLSFKNSPDYLDTRSAFLDTRGYLLYLRGRPGDAHRALIDLNSAIDLAHRAYAIERGRLEQREADPRALALEIRLPRHNLAVLYHHRGLVYRRLGRVYNARLDLDRAEQLGYNPDEGVY